MATYLGHRISENASKPSDWLDLHGDYLYRYAMLRVRDASAAEDAVQETLLAALQSYDKYEGRGSERTWLVGILKHKIIDHFRKMARTREHTQFEEQGPHAGSPRRVVGQSEQAFDPFEKTLQWAGHWRKDQAPTNWQLDASAVLEKKEFWEALDRCLSGLPQRTAIAFTLRDIDGLSSQEVSDLFGISQNNLLLMLHHSRLKLRHAIEAEWFRGEPHNSERGPNMFTKSSRTIQFAGPEHGLKYMAAVA